MIKRTVDIYEWKKDAEKGFWERVLKAKGIFHEFGRDYEELEHGPGSYSTAIVELPNGQLLNPPVEMVVFTDNGEGL